MPLRLITPPVGEPISLEQARLHLRLDASGSPPSHPDDALVEELIRTARQHLDGPAGILGRALMTQTWRLDLRGFPPGAAEILLPLPPLQSIVSINYYDTDDTLVTLAPTFYEVGYTDWNQGFVIPVIGKRWPATADRSDAVRITFVAGYGAASDIPSPLLAAMKLHIGLLYENREGVSAKTPTELPLAYHALTAPFRIMCA